ATLNRARVWAERLANPGHAALRYGQAAQYSEQALDWESAFSLRLLWVRALRASNAPERAMKEAAEIFLRTGERAGKVQRAKAVASELGVAQPNAPAPTAKGRTQTRAELIAAAD